MFSSPVYYITLTVILAALIVLLVCMIVKRRREDKVFREYMQKMDELRKLKQETETRNKNEYRTYREKKEADRIAPTNPKKETYYTTYNEREEEYIPRYAAGDDMDKLHHRQEPERKIPDWMIYIAITLLAILLLKNGIRIWFI